MNNSQLILTGPLEVTIIASKKNFIKCWVEAITLTSNKKRHSIFNIVYLTFQNWLSITQSQQNNIATAIHRMLLKSHHGSLEHVNQLTDCLIIKQVCHYTNYLRINSSFGTFKPSLILNFNCFIYSSFKNHNSTQFLFEPKILQFSRNTFTIWNWRSTLHISLLT